mmetsp:Transcript_39700/g.91772  ORF Transcript_39700/g.91772 Transcript_39700/m.91772 type:complete len:113 (-) Transcript_39700:407-745(-)
MLCKATAAAKTIAQDEHSVHTVMVTPADPARLSLLARQAISSTKGKFNNKTQSVRLHMRTRGKRMKSTMMKEKEKACSGAVCHGDMSANASIMYNTYQSGSVDGRRSQGSNT